MKRILSFALALTLVSFSALVAIPGAPAFAESGGTTERVSVAANGTDGDNMSLGPSISADGRYVAFSSMASNLVEGDILWTEDVFVRDRETGQTTWVSVATKAAGGLLHCSGPALSGDGNYLAHTCFDSRGRASLFLWDRSTGNSSQLSVAMPGAPSPGGGGSNPSISADGRYVAFESTDGLVAGDNAGNDVYLHDRQTGETVWVSVGMGGPPNGDSYNPSISADGRFVAFESQASNLVDGDNAGHQDIFVYDRGNGQITRVSVPYAGGEANDDSEKPAISADGLYVAFKSLASNLVAGDSNGEGDVFVHDMKTGGETTRVSVATGGGEADGPSYMKGSISADGRYVAFASSASNLAPGDSNGKMNVFVQDRIAGETTRVSVATDGGRVDGDSDAPALSADGRFVAFVSYATNLVPNDINGASDVFLYSGPPNVTPPAYNICPLYDETKEKKAGSNIALKLQVCDADGTNRSAEQIVVTATHLSLVDGSVTVEVEPPNTFRYDEESAAYIFNVRTKGLSPGTWDLWLSVAGDTKPHEVQIVLR